MVKTRASQGPEPSDVVKQSHKRRHSEVELVVEHTDGLQPHPQTKARKTRRRFTSADEQLQEDERYEPSEAGRPLGSSPPPQQLVKSHIEAEDLPAVPTNELRLPGNIQFVPLKDAIKKCNEERRLLANDPEQGLALSQATNTYIDLADLDVDTERLMTPVSTSFGPLLRDYTPLASHTRATPDRKRESKIEKYEHAIEELTQEKAEAVSGLQVLDLGVKSLGFGKVDDSGQDICAAVRTAFDQARADVSELLTNHHLDVSDLENDVFLERLVDVIRDLLFNIERLENEVRGEKTMVAFVQAEYDGVFKKLSEMVEKQEELRRVNDKLDKSLDARIRGLDAEHKKYEALLADHNAQAHELKAKDKEIIALNKTRSQQAEQIVSLKDICNQLQLTIDNLKAQMTQTEAEHKNHVLELEADRDERLGYMVQELNQEHRYRVISEKINASKEAELTSLQVRFEKAKSDHENAEDQIKGLNERVTGLDQDLETTKQQLSEKETAIEALDEQVARLNDKVDEITADIEELSELRNDASQQLEVTMTELEQSTEKVASLEKHIKESDLEINKLRGQLFGAQQEIKDLTEDRDATQEAYNAELAAKQELQTELTTKEVDIEELQRAIESQDKAMVALQQAMDEEIRDKNRLLDQVEAEKEHLEQDFAAKVEEKDAKIEGLEADIDDLASQLKDADQTTAQLRTDVGDLTTANEEKAAEISDLQSDSTMIRRRNTKLESDVQVRDADIQALRQEVFEITSEKETVEKVLDTKEKELAMMIALNAKLVDSAERDAALAQEWAERKIVEAGEGKALVNALVTAGDMKGVVVQTQTQTTKVKTVKKKKASVVRDSGFMGSDGYDEIEGGGAMLIEG